MKTGARTVRQFAACMLCALALLFSGVTHHPQARVLPADIADYVLPDGSFPDLCLTGEDGHGGHDDNAAHGCGPCCLSVVPGLPLPDVVFVTADVSRPTGDIFPPSPRVVRRTLVAGSGPRAPPGRIPL